MSPSSCFPGKLQLELSRVDRVGITSTAARGAPIRGRRYKAAGGGVGAGFDLTRVDIATPLHRHAPRCVAERRGPTYGRGLHCVARIWFRRLGALALEAMNG